MTNENINDKRARFLDMQEHPELYTDEQIENLLADEDIKEFARYMAMTKRALVAGEAEEPNVDATWQAFSASHIRHRFAWRKAAAITTGVVSLSGIALAAALQLGLFHHSQPTPPVPSAPNSTHIVALDSLRRDTLTQAKDSLDLTPVVFDNATLATVLTQMGQYYHVEVVFRNAQSRQLRLYFKWDKRLSLERQLELLNAFDRLHLTLSDHTLTVE